MSTVLFPTYKDSHKHCAKCKVWISLQSFKKFNGTCAVCYRRSAKLGGGDGGVRGPARESKVALAPIDPAYNAQVQEILDIISKHTNAKVIITSERR